MATSVEQFMQLAPQLMQEAAAYAASGQSDPETEGNIRQLRVMATALQAALMQVGSMPPMVTPQQVQHR